MEALIVEGVRCFRERQEVPLAPLTILVGENSTGKSTFLALLRIAWEIAQGGFEPDFNEEPFHLGAYEQIAHFHGGQGKRANHFRIGARLPPHGLEADHLEAQGVFEERSAHPKLVEWHLAGGATRMTVSLRSATQSNVSIASGGLSASAPWPRMRFPLAGAMFGHIAFHALMTTPAEPDDDDARAGLRERIQTLEERYRQAIDAEGACPRAFAPVRSKPQRTYDPIRDVPVPAGEHVPAVLANLAAGEEEAWKTVQESLRNFGEASGLLDALDVRRKGKKASDPFQIHVKIGGFPFNLIDVGYGVSQILPILVDSLLASPGSSFLLQQPEVHLHPRAQAELGTFLATLVRAARKRFIVETHSDYLIDRIRMDIRDRKTIAPEEVRILYFERDGNQVTIHPLTLDADGEFDDVPDGYRDFFLREQRRFLGGVSGVPAD